MSKALAFQGLNPPLLCVRIISDEMTPVKVLFTSTQRLLAAILSTAIRYPRSVVQQDNRNQLFLKIFWLRENSHTSYHVGYVID